MKSISNCPVCKSPLLNEYVTQVPYKEEVIIKSCRSFIHHKFKLLELYSGEVEFLALKISNNHSFIWSFVNGQLFLSTDINLDNFFYLPFFGATKEAKCLPFFEPDLERISILINKLKICSTYL